jgi:hypothetical protein
MVLEHEFDSHVHLKNLIDKTDHLMAQNQKQLGQPKGASHTKKYLKNFILGNARETKY